MAITVEEAKGEDTQTKLVAKRDHARDEVQKWVDEKVADLVKRYHEAGDPEAGPEAPFLRLVVKKDERAELRTKINRAFTLASSPEDAPDVVPWFYLDAKEADGKVSVKFNVQPRPLTKAERETQEKASAEASATPGEGGEGTPAEGTQAGEGAPAGDQEGTQDQEAGQGDQPKPGGWRKR